MKIVKDFERMGDHLENIIELTGLQITKKVKTTETAMGNLPRNV